MNSSKLFYVAFCIALLVTSSSACDRKNVPCPSNQCCFLVYTFLNFSWSFCLELDANNARCAQNNYCLSDNDCDGTDVCDGVQFFQWGRCTSVNPCVNPPNKKKRLIDAALGIPREITE